MGPKRSDKWVGKKRLRGFSSPIVQKDEKIDGNGSPEDLIKSLAADSGWSEEPELRWQES